MHAKHVCVGGVWATHPTHFRVARTVTDTPQMFIPNPYGRENQLDGFKIVKVDAGRAVLDIESPRKGKEPSYPADGESSQARKIGDNFIVANPGIEGGTFHCTADPSSLVGRTIDSTERLPWRDGAPRKVAPKSGDQMVIVWHLRGGGMLYPCADVGATSPAGAAEVFMEDNGSMWPLLTHKNAADLAAEKRQQAADLAGRKCACGSFKTPGQADGLCNACRSKKRARSEPAVDHRPSTVHRAATKCPTCGKDLSELGPLRTERHVKKCQN